MAGSKRNLTKNDLMIKARILSEGVRLSGFKRAGIGGGGDLSSAIVLDGCDLVSVTPPNKASRLEVACDDNDRVIISDVGEVLATGSVQERASWRDMKLENGQMVENVLLGMSHTIINILFHYSCDNWNTGRPCQYCGLFAFAAAKPMAMLSMDMLSKMAGQQAEAVKIATDHGWRGTLAVSGGAILPERRGEYLDMLDTVMTPLREQLSEDVLNELHILLNGYPPKDFEDMNTWRELGINATEFDLEVLDPSYFAAICPGKHEYGPLEFWKEAQDASVEIFGPGRGTTTAVVVGMEPINTLVDGIDERVSRGIFPTPLNFIPTKGSNYEDFRPPSARWLIEAAERTADSFIEHMEQLGCDLFDDQRFGCTRTGRSHSFMLTTDEITRRGQELGLVPPGLPKQDGN